MAKYRNKVTNSEVCSAKGPNWGENGKQNWSCGCSNRGKKSANIPFSIPLSPPFETHITTIFNNTLLPSPSHLFLYPPAKKLFHYWDVLWSCFFLLSFLYFLICITPSFGCLYLHWSIDFLKLLSRALDWLGWQAITFAVKNLKTWKLCGIAGFCWVRSQIPWYHWYLDELVSDSALQYYSLFFVIVFLTVETPVCTTYTV